MLSNLRNSSVSSNLTSFIAGGLLCTASWILGTITTANSPCNANDPGCDNRTLVSVIDRPTPCDANDPGCGNRPLVSVMDSPTPCNPADPSCGSRVPRA